MNETIRKQKTEKHEVGRTSGPTGKSRFAGRNVLLSAGLGLALTATCGGSSSSPNTTDAGACTMVKGTDGLNTCTPADVCELGLVPDNPTSDGGTSKAGCVPKQKRDASPVEASQGEVSEDAEAAEVPPIVDTAPVSPVDVAEPDAKVAVDTSVDAGPVCTVKKATRAYVKLGSNWRIAGYACDTNGSESKMDDGVTVERKTETGDFETCAVAVTPGTATSVTATPKGVTVTCPTVTIQAGTGGCTQTAVEETSACANTNSVLVTGGTTVSANLGSKAVVNVAATQSQRIYLPKDSSSQAGSEAGTDNLNLAGTPVTAKLASLGVGDDGKVVVAGKVPGPTGKTTCGTAVGASPVQIGDVTVSSVISEADVRDDSAFTADMAYDANDFNGVSENGATLNFGGVRVTVPGIVVSGNSAAVVLKEAVSSKKPCVVLTGEGSDVACGIQYNAKPVSVNAGYHKNSCAVKTGDAGATQTTDTAKAGPVVDAGAPDAVAVGADVFAPSAPVEAGAPAEAD